MTFACLTLVAKNIISLENSLSPPTLQEFSFPNVPTPYVMFCYWSNSLNFTKPNPKMFYLLLSLSKNQSLYYRVFILQRQSVTNIA